MTNPRLLLRVAALASSLLLVVSYVCLRTGILHRVLFVKMEPGNAMTVSPTNEESDLEFKSSAAASEREIGVQSYDDLAINPVPTALSSQRGPRRRPTMIKQDIDRRVGPPIAQTTVTPMAGSKSLVMRWWEPTFPSSKMPAPLVISPQATEGMDDQVSLLDFKIYEFDSNQEFRLNSPSNASKLSRRNISDSEEGLFNLKLLGLALFQFDSDETPHGNPRFTNMSGSKANE